MPAPRSKPAAAVAPAGGSATEPAGGAGSSEFTVPTAAATDRRHPVRWILSLQRRSRWFVAGWLFGLVGTIALNTSVPSLTGAAFDTVLGHGDRLHGLAVLTFALLAVVVFRGLLDLLARSCVVVLAQRTQADAREELYVSLLGKSQTFHNRQRVGDLMARAASDVRQLSAMVNPGIDLVTDSMVQGIAPLVFIAVLDWRLLLSPVLLALGFVVAIRHYLRQLGPVSTRLREQYGDLSAGITEVVHGIEVVKAMAQEPRERLRFRATARAYRDSFVRQGLIQAWYLPTLLLAVAMAGALLQGLYLHAQGELSTGDLVAYLGLMGMLGYPMGMSSFTFSLVQLGVVSARRILALVTERTELDQNTGGYRGTVRGDVEFDHVTFGYEPGMPPVLADVTVHISAGQTVALVGETGSGKSTLTKLVNRIYDVDGGAIRVDGVDVRAWNLDALRSQISTIEQDITLFSRSVAENIAFSLGQRADRAAIERAAADAQAAGFIAELPAGYDTVIGERGVTLSGGQRQRLAIARALLTDPGILVVDDSTSAIDSATEDDIQHAIRRIQQGRTTLLITHRLSQIRWADAVLLLRRGRVVDYGSHEELLGRCALYRRIFAHYVPAPDGRHGTGDGTAAQPGRASGGGAGRASGGASPAGTAAGPARAAGSTPPGRTTSAIGGDG